MRKYSIIQKKRRAIAMIELIFSIVVMGIAMSAIPMLVNRSAQSIYTSLQQEAIAAATTQISTIISAQWDHADTNTTEGGPILLTESSQLSLCSAAGDAQPAGVTSSSGRYCKGTQSGNSYNADTSFGTEGTTYESQGHYDDIDDYNGQSYTVKIYSGESATAERGNYIDTNISVTSNIYYGDHQPRELDNTPSSGGYDRNITFSNPFKRVASGTSNIKLITVTLSSSNPNAELSDKSIRLSTFMCNIGSPSAEIVNNDPY
jgi:type II secretory pathway pseudopilin PulG